MLRMIRLFLLTEDCMASRLRSITGRSLGSCQISGEDVDDTVDTMGRQGGL